MTHVSVIVRAGNVGHGRLASFREMSRARITSTASRPLLMNESDCLPCARHMIPSGMVYVSILVRLVIVQRWPHILHGSIQDPGSGALDTCSLVFLLHPYVHVCASARAHTICRSSWVGGMIVGQGVRGCVIGVICMPLMMSGILFFSVPHLSTSGQQGNTCLPVTMCPT